MSSTKVALVEVFRSPQGEGYNAGRQAVFVRFAGCNLSCVFAEHALCDTPYQAATIKCTVDELFDSYIRDFVPPWEPFLIHSKDSRLMLILTGGEPTLAPAFDDVVEEGVKRGFYVAVETNGSRYRPSLDMVDWISCSPKMGVPQGSPAPFHNHNPEDPTLHERVISLLDRAEEAHPGEYRYVIGPDSLPPPYHSAFRHYLSPAVLSDGSGAEWKQGFPGFVPGALERALEISAGDPRWRISIQTHKVLKVR